MITLIIVDMQVGLFGEETPRFDSDGVMLRINRLSGAVRDRGGKVIFIQHDGPPGDSLEPKTPGWEILPDLIRDDADIVVRKSACDAFYKTDLERFMLENDCGRIIITGCATDFCVDTTVRSAASKDFGVIVVSDGHTTADRPHLDAKTIVQHHNFMWENLILPGRRVRVISAENLLDELYPD